MLSYTCDKCLKTIQSNVEHCEMCGSHEKHYHKSCLKRTKDFDYYCEQHLEEQQQEEKESAILDGYFQKFWKDVGFINVCKDDDRVFTARFYGNDVRIIYDPIRTESQLTGLECQIDGLTAKTKTIKFNIGSHEEAKKEVQKMLVRSASSKKAAITKDYNYQKSRAKELEEQHARDLKSIDDMIATLK